MENLRSVHLNWLYGRAIADQLGVELIASFNQNDFQTLGTYGVERVIQISDPKLEKFMPSGMPQIWPQS